MERKEVKARVDELMRQLDSGEIDRAEYVERFAQLQIDADNVN
jgi:hypothetical protein